MDSPGTGRGSFGGVLRNHALVAHHTNHLTDSGRITRRECRFGHSHIQRLRSHCTIHQVVTEVKIFKIIFEIVATLL